jgi:Caspase domain/Domain of unknown function (DUF4384)
MTTARTIGPRRGRCAAIIIMFCLAGCGSAVAQTKIFHAPQLTSNHALIITVSGYQRSPLPGVLLDHDAALEMAQRFGVPKQNIVELSEQQVTREGLKEALARMAQAVVPGDKLWVYFSGHGARFFSKATGQCTESLVMQDMHVVTNREFATMLRPLSAKTDKTIVMLDSCHSGGVAQATAARDIGSRNGERPKFSTEASSPECSLAVNLGTFSNTRGADLNTTDNNLVILAAARNNEIAWDTLDGGALTHNFQECFAGEAKDADHSGGLSMQELADCVQARLDKKQEESARQHVTLAGNGALVAAFGEAHHGSGPAASADALATLNDIYNQRDDRWQIEASVGEPTLKIGTNLTMAVRSQRDGFVYVFYQGTRPGSFFLLFPNQLDSANAIKANQELRLPNKDWSVTALGPPGTDHLMVIVTATARDFSTLALPAEYVSQSGPFAKFQPSTSAAAQISQIATLSAAAIKGECGSIDNKRDLGVARRCSNVFGARLVSTEETQ